MESEATTSSPPLPERRKRSKQLVVLPRLPPAMGLDDSKTAVPLRRQATPAFLPERMTPIPFEAAAMVSWERGPDPRRGIIDLVTEASGEPLRWTTPSANGSGDNDRADLMITAQDGGLVNTGAKAREEEEEDEEKEQEGEGEGEEEEGAMDLLLDDVQLFRR